MTLNLPSRRPRTPTSRPRITVIGVGGGGTNAVDNMIAANLQGVEFVVANTDAQQLMHSRADRRIQLGPHITQGLGAGAKPEIGKAAAEEAADELYRHLDGAHMVFITAGMGGGTGTGAAPVIARMARERNILTVGVVTKPFGFEGVRRARCADQGIEELQQFVDTLIVIPNQNLFRMANERTTWKEAFKMADQVLYMGVRGVTDLMMVPGLINLDFADIRTVMAEMGKAMMGTGEAEGENRAIRAAEAAISNPLLEDTSMAGARGLLINITGGDDLTLFEVDQAVNRIREEVDDDANIIFGSAIDRSAGSHPRLRGRHRHRFAGAGRARAAAPGRGRRRRDTAAAPIPLPMQARSLPVRAMAAEAPVMRSAPLRRGCAAGDRHGRGASAARRSHDDGRRPPAGRPSLWRLLPVAQAVGQCSESNGDGDLLHPGLFAEPSATRRGGARSSSGGRGRQAEPVQRRHWRVPAADGRQPCPPGRRPARVETMTQEPRSEPPRRLPCARLRARECRGLIFRLSCDASHPDRSGYLRQGEGVRPYHARAPIA